MIVIVSYCDQISTTQKLVSISIYKTWYPYDGHDNHLLYGQYGIHPYCTLYREGKAQGPDGTGAITIRWHGVTVSVQHGAQP